MVAGQNGVIVQLLVEVVKGPELENVNQALIQVHAQEMELKEKPVILILVQLPQPHQHQLMLNGMNGHLGQIVQ